MEDVDRRLLGVIHEKERAMGRFRSCVVVVVSVFFVCGEVLALPPGLAKKGKTPPGFSKGRKKKWQDEYPPGWSKKSEADKKRWKERVRKGREHVKKEAENKGLDADAASKAADEFEKAARKGADLDKLEDVVIDKIKKGKKVAELAVELADEVADMIKGKSGGKH